MGKPKTQVKRATADTRKSLPVRRQTIRRSPPASSTKKEEGGLKQLFRMINRSYDLLSSKLTSLEEKVNSQTSSTSTINSVQNGVEAPALQRNERVCYNIQNLSIEKPRFSSARRTHPVTFIEDLSVYLKKVSCDGRELEVAVDCLVDEARDWARIYKSRWDSFEDFKIDFLDTYWGETEQSVLRRNIVHNKWNKSVHPTMLGHFLQLTGQAKMLTYQIPEKQLVSDIMRHYSKDVQYIWSLNKTSSILEAAELLRGLDDINKQGEESETSNSAVENRSSYKGPKKFGGWKKGGQSTNRRPNNTLETNVVETVENEETPANVDENVELGGDLN